MKKLYLCLVFLFLFSFIENTMATTSHIISSHIENTINVDSTTNPILPSTSMILLSVGLINLFIIRRK